MPSDSFSTILFSSPSTACIILLPQLFKKRENPKIVQSLKSHSSITQTTDTCSHPYRILAMRSLGARGGFRISYYYKSPVNVEGSTFYLQKGGWPTGFEPATFGATIRCSTD